MQLMWTQLDLTTRITHMSGRSKRRRATRAGRRRSTARKHFSHQPPLSGFSFFGAEMHAQILDPCCGGQMMWFDRKDQRALFGDIRSEEHTLCDGRAFNITPDLNMDFRAMPFPDESFRLVVFDPPHLRRAGHASWLRAKYGILTDDWEDDLRRGLAECFRVLKPEGVLIFKWADIQMPISKVLALTPEKPLFGHKSGKREKTHWVTFIKQPTQPL